MTKSYINAVFLSRRGRKSTNQDTQAESSKLLKIILRSPVTPTKYQDLYNSFH
jgi:hypothetical protein